MAFRGTFDYTLDAKNRLTVPAKFRPQFAGGLVLARGLRPHLGLWVPAEFDAYVESVLKDFHPLSNEHADLTEHFAGGSLDVELDAAGRIGLPPRQMDYAHLAKEVVVSGATTHLQIWSREAWDERESGRTARVTDITRRLSGMPIPSTTS